MSAGSGKAGFRFRDGGWEGKCQVCREWLPLDNEYWRAYDGASWGRCRACLREYQAEWGRRRQASLTPEQAEAERAERRAVRRVKDPLTRHRQREAGRRHYIRHRDEVRARARARFAALPEAEKERIRARNRERQRANRKPAHIARALP